MKNRIIHICSLAILCLSAQFLSAQAVTIETETVPVEIYRLPRKPLDSSVKTYSAAITLPGSDLSTIGLSSKDLVDQYVVLEGFPRTYTNSDVNVNVTIGNLQVTGEKLESRKTRSVDKEGNQITKHEFFYELNYSVPAKYTLTDKTGKVIAEEIIADHSQQKYYKTGVYASDTELDSWWRINKSQKLAELQRDMMKEHLTNLRERLNLEHGYMVVKEQARLENIGKKKHPDFEKFNAQFMAVKSALSTLKANSDLKALEKSLMPAIDFYKAAAESYNAADKEQVKLKHIALYNLASIYFWLDDFETSSMYVTQLLAIDPKDKDALKLSEDISSTRAALTGAGKTCRHEAAAAKM